jgi:hypothetical protein
MTFDEPSSSPTFGFETFGAAAIRFFFLRLSFLFFFLITTEPSSSPPYGLEALAATTRFFFLRLSFFFFF